MIETNASKIWVLHGPNMNLLGKREPETYGVQSLAELDQQLVDLAKQQNIELACQQSNSEADLITAIHSNNGEAFMIFNPAGFTHTSVALRDALIGTETRFIEVHISNPARREEFRRISYFADIAEAVIAGCGTDGYQYALATAMKLI